MRRGSVETCDSRTAKGGWKSGWAWFGACSELGQAGAVHKFLGWLSAYLKAAAGAERRWAESFVDRDDLLVVLVSLTLSLTCDGLRGLAVWYV